MIARAAHSHQVAGLSEADCWRAVQERDARQDGRFVHGVKSTGIYCRPSCPSRQPGRAQVVFFPTPEAAEEAGFRACRRCQPQLPPADTHEMVLVRRVCQYIQDHSQEPLTLARLGQVASLSPHHLQRVFKRVTGVTPRQYRESCRLGAFKNGLRQGETITAALYQSGYGSPSRLYEGASARLGMTPATYRRGGPDLPVAYTVVECALGYLLLAATGRGVCAVRLGDAAGPLETDLRREFPAAAISRDDAGLGEWTRAVLQHLAGQRPHLDLPLDVQATAFQQLVWEQLRKIPYGETRTYGELARELGQPQASRAVGRACATNPVALLVPCHRAVRKDGQPGGYRWGVSRKQTLLERESEQPLHPY